MATAKQIEANRLNALLSTGPKTDLGKAAARRNALKHGLAGAGIVMPIGEEELVQERTAELCSSLKPMHTFDLFLTEEVALEQLRAERCRRLERARRQRLAEDALERWDEQRIIAAEQLGARLSKEPALSARRLQQTVQGCDWLLARWHGLGRVLEGCGAWDEAQRRLALDLLGTPPELRRGGTPLDPSRAVSLSAADGIGAEGPPPTPTLSFRERVAARPPGEGASGTGDASREDALTRPLRSPPLPGGEGGNGSDGQSCGGGLDGGSREGAAQAVVPDDDAPTRCVRVVITEIERLTRLRDEVLDPRDEAEQRAAFYGEGVETDPELHLLHRYEAACQRRKAWALKQLNKGHGPRAGAGSVYPLLGERVAARPPGEGGGAIHRDSLQSDLEGNERAHAAPPLCAPFPPPISGGAPLPHEGRDAPPWPMLGGLRGSFSPRRTSGNRRERRARGRF